MKTIRKLLLPLAPERTLIKDAQRLFTEQQAPSLKIVGVDNLPTRADLAGHRLITVQAPDGSRYVLDLGLAHAMNSCPMNLISVSLLNQVGAIVHFERDHCYFQAHPGATKIPFDQRNGLFQLDVGRGGAPGTPRVAPSYALLGRCLATTVTMKPDECDTCQACPCSNPCRSAVLWMDLS